MYNTCFIYVSLLLVCVDNLDDLVNHRGVGEGSDISKLVFLTSQNLSQDTSHDLATASLGKIGDCEHSLWCSEWTDALTDLENEILAQLIGEFVAVLDRDECIDGLTGELVAYTNDSGFSDCVMLDKCSFDLGGGETVTGHVDDIVDTTANPVVALVIAGGTITSELGTLSAWFSPHVRLSDTYVVTLVHV